ncbi:PREDICTED: glutathione S-transferase omega-like 2 [Fragaria vesca subsp. vesca]|uniref:glutathione S-transferase omega-like 2 n=1 Tax=Fragaria vesca subsp. vesca TaxID=101020 RepID=UPI0002C3750F|nr:PREDICTED: glutathione S-transferase omega-like 2 [Fragaria vesca subsp. vesca]
MNCSSASLLSSSFLPAPPPNTNTSSSFKLPQSKPNRRHVTAKMSLNKPPDPTSLLTSVTNLLWGPSLPPGLLISTVRSAWNTTWRLMMSQLAPSDPSLAYTRPPSRFRATQIPRQNRTSLHLYVGLPCPWAHRALIVRSLKGLESAVPVSIASPGNDGSWEFKTTRDPDPDTLDPTRDKANGYKTLKQVYKSRPGGYDGRSTVPMLWDSNNKEVVCNESYDIIELFNSGLNEMAHNPGLDLSPPSLKPKIEEWNSIIYPNVNNGVYRCGFAQSQEAYDVAVNDLFNTLDKLEDHLSRFRYLCGDELTLADVCLFTTLIRFDLAYNVLFKCTRRKLVEYPNLHAYMRDIYQIPKVAETCNFQLIMEGYYKTLFPLNPGSIQPIIPVGSEHQELLRPHNRDSLCLKGARESASTLSVS